jgi:hypothetical protein
MPIDNRTQKGAGKMTAFVSETISAAHILRRRSENERPCEEEHAHSAGSLDKESSRFEHHALSRTRLMRLYLDKGSMALFFQRLCLDGHVAHRFVKGRGFAFRGLSCGGQGEDSHLQMAVAAAQLNQVSDLNCAGRFGLRPVDTDNASLAQLLRDAATRRQTARLEEQV